ncbi:MAG: extracellular solute-binding protein [Planctomycetota bacterium]|nr:extracellular solute-binding protein [Planctomycetota bacterium]
MVRFPLGTPIFVLLVLAFASGAGVWTLKPASKADLVVWCFAEAHARTYRDPFPGPGGGHVPSLARQFQLKTSKSVGIELIGQQAEDIRLVSLFMSQSQAGADPGLCEIEIGSVGKFFRAPIDDIGLLPLNDFLNNSDEYRHILRSRFAPWSKIDPRTGREVIFGIPDDVHPITLTYRKDLFDEAGLDPEQAKTWSEFRAICLKLQDYRSHHGHPTGRAMELSTTSPNHLVMMLLQRHINIVDSANRVHLAEPKVAQTVAFYASLISGAGAIGGDTDAGGGAWARDLLAGDVCAILTPDWRAGDIPEFAPGLAGKLRMMPLPRFDADDASTSTAGGTMIGIPRACKDPALAWQLLEFLYLSPEARAARLAAGTSVIPPEPELWTDPVYHQPDPFFAGQKIEELYVSLAPQIPLRQVTPYTIQAEFALSLVLYKARAYMENHGPIGLTEQCALWLQDAQEELQRRIDFGKFEP